MNRQTPTGWILFAAMWLSGPIAGYSACNLIAILQERRAVERRDSFAFGVSGSLMLVSTLALVFVQGL